MASILKVDTIQKPDGSTPTVSDLGITDAGRILQTVHSSLDYSTSASTTSSTFVDSGLSATITPTSASSKIIVIADIAMGGDQAPAYAIYRDATTYLTGTRKEYQADYSWPTNLQNASLTVIDTPNTTSSITYNVMFAALVSGATYLNRSGTNYRQSSSSITLIEVSA